MKMRLWFIRESANARFYSRVPMDRHPELSDCLWIPRSVVEHTTKRGIEHEVTLPDWFIDKENL